MGRSGVHDTRVPAGAGHSRTQPQKKKGEGVPWVLEKGRYLLPGVGKAIVGLLDDVPRALRVLVYVEQNVNTRGSVGASATCLQPENAMRPTEADVTVLGGGHRLVDV